MKQSKPFIAVLCVLLMAAPGVYSQQLNDRGPTLEHRKRALVFRIHQATTTQRMFRPSTFPTAAAPIR